MPETRPRYLTAAAALICSVIVPLIAWAAPTGPVTPEQPAEFMIYQYPDTILVLRVDVPETEFSVQTIGPEDARLKATSVVGRRVGPVYQFIDATSEPRQLMIEVTPARPVERAGVRLEVLQFAEGDPNAAPLAQAYQLFSIGAETSHSTDASTWAMKTYSLRNAAATFADLGMEEMRLWSEYFAAHLVLHQLHDSLMALELVRELQPAARRAGYEEILLAAGILEGDAVLRLAASSDERLAADYRSRAHGVLSGVATLASHLGLIAEHGRALFHDGRVFELEGDPERALQQYQAALEVTANSGDAELLNEIRGTAATVYKAVGRTSGALALLDDIAGDLAAAEQQDADLELADRLLEKGRLLNDSYRYSEAIGELSRALKLREAQAGTEPWALAGLELAWSHYSLGDADEAVGLLERAIPAVSRSSNARELARAYGSLANVYRVRGSHQRATEFRDKQGRLIRGGAGQVEFLLESAADARYRDGRGSAAARDLLQRARQVAAKESDAVGLARAELGLCLLDLERDHSGECAAARAASAFEIVQRAGIPRLAADASLMWARVLRVAGRRAEARRVLQALVDELFRYRRALPGVLGAWFVENRDAVGGEYLSLTRSGVSRAAAESMDGRELLLATEHVRMLEAAPYVRAGQLFLDEDVDEALRGLLARRETASGPEAKRLAVEVNRTLAAVGEGVASIDALFSATDLDRLLADLTEAEAVLTYYFGADGASALLAQRGAVRLVELKRVPDLANRLEQLRDGLARPGPMAIVERLDALGKILLGPLKGMLPPKVYFLPTGPMRGIPFDALRLSGRFLAEQHQLVNIASLPATERRALRMPEDFAAQVFLAGNPQEQRDPFNLEVRTSPEIVTVTGRFVGPGLHIVQGVALQKDEFADDRFAQAGLIHLALSGTMDLNVPDQSRLLLAAAPMDDNESGVAGGGFLLAEEVRAFELNAHMVLLSGTTIVGGSQSLFDSRIAIVADFLAAGSRAVVATLWPPGEEVGASFSTELYRELLPGSDLESTLASTKRGRIRAVPPTNLRSWAGFQLYIR